MHAAEYGVEPLPGRNVFCIEGVSVTSFCLQCGMTLYPSSAYLHILYANYLISARKDGQGSRIQLQLASSKRPNFIESWMIYASKELTKNFKASGTGLDLHGYIEFQRNYKYDMQRVLFTRIVLLVVYRCCSVGYYGMHLLTAAMNWDVPTCFVVTCGCCRACIHAHKLALMAQRQFWSKLLHDSVHFSSLQTALDVMEKAEARATQVYRR